MTVKEVRVLNLATGDEALYVGVSPREAVIAAACQFPSGVAAAQRRPGALNVVNANTWEYAQVAPRVYEGHQTVSCGDWAALRR